MACHALFMLYFLMIKPLLPFLNRNIIHPHDHKFAKPNIDLLLQTNCKLCAVDSKLFYPYSSLAATPDPIKLAVYVPCLRSFPSALRVLPPRQIKARRLPLRPLPLICCRLYRRTRVTLWDLPTLLPWLTQRRQGSEGGEVRALSWNDISVSFTSLVTSTVLSPPDSSPAAASLRRVHHRSFLLKGSCRWNLFQVLQMKMRDDI